MTERFAPEALVEDALLGGRVLLTQPRAGYRAGVDAVLLAAAAPAAPGARALDLGCGAGAAALCLAARVPALELHGLELQPAYGALAQRNARRMGVAFTLHPGDVAAPPPTLRALDFDVVFANPPYFPAGAAAPSPVAAKDRAHRESAPLCAWIDCGLRRLRGGGRLALIQRAERLPEMLAALAGRAGDLRVKPVAGRAGRAAGRVIVTARKGARGPFRLCAPLVMHDGPRHEGDFDDYSSEARAILRDGAALDF